MTVLNGSMWAKWSQVGQSGTKGGQVGEDKDKDKHKDKEKDKDKDKDK